MNSANWERVKEILASALELEPAARPAYLDRSCGGDITLRAEVDEYLRYESPAGEVFAVTALRDAPGPVASDPAERPSHVGPYRLVRLLGEGGMGVVYLGERDDGEYSQQVAVKLMRPGAHLARRLHLFRQERQILARLDHPNIARLLDGGTTARGQLYYVMEFVDGIPLTRWCRDHGVSLDDKLRLFLKVCAAVSHAHRSLIIHRDLKPANILVTAEGKPKLLDFGLAKIFQPHAAEDAQSTVPLLTPGYASPEQVRGDALTTATDVYSLGVVLYELLTEESPYRSTGSSPLETYRAVCEQEPRRPGALRRLPRDLDDIVLKALRKEPDARYSSVDQLRLDLERHLNGLPVEASRGTLSYRAAKFVRRHRWGVAATAVAVLGAGLALAALLHQSRQTERRFEQVRSLARSVVFEFHDAIQDLPGSTPARKLLVERALQYLKELQATSGKNRELQLELAQAYMKIGDVQGHQSRANLGDTTGALDSFQRAYDLVRPLRERFPDDRQVLWAFVQALAGRTDLLEIRGDQQRWASSQAELEAALEDRARRFPHLPETRAALVRSRAYHALVDSDWPRAARLFREALPLAWQVAAANPDNPNTTRTIVSIHANLAKALQYGKDKPGALHEYREAARIQRLLLDRHPGDARLRMEYSFRLVELGWLLHELHLDAQAVDCYQQCLAIQQDLSEHDPLDYRARMELAKLKITAAPAFEASGRAGHAAALLAEARLAFLEQLRQDPADHDIRLHLGWACQNIADLASRQRQPALAHQAYQEAAAALAALPKQDYLSGIFDPVQMLGYVQGRLKSCRPEACPPLSQ